MHRTAATQFVKTASRTMSVSSSNVAGTAGASRAAAFAREPVSNPATQYMKSPSKPSLRMRIIINGRGIVQTQELSSIRPTMPGSMSRFHTSATARSFYPEVYSEGVFVLAGDEVHDAVSFSTVRNDAGSSSSEFNVGQVQTVSNAEYST
jgi:hypothetical protein